MEKKLRSLLISGEIEEAINIYQNMEKTEARDVLLTIAYDMESIIPYSFY